MQCLNLTNGDFVLEQFSAVAAVNTGNVTVTRDASSILIEHSAFASGLSLSGRWEHLVFGGGTLMALLRFIDGAPGSAQRTVFIVDFTGAMITTTQIIDQGSVANSIARPQIMLSPGNQALAFVFSADGFSANQINHLAIFRSDDGALVMPGPLSVSDLNGTIGASVTATELVMTHPNQFAADTTPASRPAGQCNVTNDPIAFGQAVLGATNAALATIARTATIRNDGLDCLSITAIANSAPYTVDMPTLAALPVVLAPGGTFDVGIVFAPTTSGNFSRNLALTISPNNGDGQIACNGSARMAVAQISTSTATMGFGILVHPAAATQSYTISNSGEIDLTVTIAGPPVGSDFTWASIAAAAPLALAVGAVSPMRTVTYTTSGDGAATPQDISIVPSAGATTKTIHCTGAGCVPNSVITMPAIHPLALNQVERGFRTVRFIEVQNDGDSDLTFSARIQATAVPAQAANFGLVLPENDITDAPSTRMYSVLPLHRCGAGPTGPNTVVVAVGFFADGASGAYSAELVVELHNATNVPAATTWTFPLTAEIIDPIPVDIALVIDHSGSMNDPAWSRNKMQAALAGAKLLVQMLRDTADDRCAVVGFNATPAAAQHIALAGPNRAALLASLGPPVFVAGGATNIAGGAIVGSGELATAHPSNPPQLKKAMVVLTDGMENRCYQIGGVDPWYSITGRDNDMFRPDDVTAQNTDPWPAPSGVKVYAIGLGGPGDIDVSALDTLAVATGGSYQGAQDLTGKNYFLLEKYFTQIFMETAGLSQISDPFYTIDPNTRHSHEFDILPGDVNAMVVIYDEPGRRLPFYIESPQGELLSGTSLPAGFSLRHRSTPTARFAEFFFPAKQPLRYVGKWTVWIEHRGFTCSGETSRDDGGKAHHDHAAGFLPRKCEKDDQPVDYGIAIGAGSNLRMQPFVEPGTKYVGDSVRLNAIVAEAGLPVTDSTVRVTVTAPNGMQWLVTLADDGAHQDGAAGDGDYGGLFTQTYVAGNYQLEFSATGTRGDGTGMRVQTPYARTAHRTKAIYDKRQPPPDSGGGGGGGNDDCCRRLLRALHRQEKLLHKLLTVK